MPVTVVIEWKVRDDGVIGKVDVLKSVLTKFENPFTHKTVDGSKSETLHTETKKYKSQLAFFRHIVNDYYLSQKFKWERVWDENNLMILKGELKQGGM